MDPFEHLPEKCTLREAALALGISKETLRRAVQAQALPSHLTRGPKGPQLIVEKKELLLWHAGRMGLAPIFTPEENLGNAELDEAPQHLKGHSLDQAAPQEPHLQTQLPMGVLESDGVLPAQATHPTQDHMALVSLNEQGVAFGDESLPSVEVGKVRDSHDDPRTSLQENPEVISSSDQLSVESNIFSNSALESPKADSKSEVADSTFTIQTPDRLQDFSTLPSSLESESNNGSNEAPEESPGFAQTSDRQMDRMVHASHEAVSLSHESNEDSAMRSLGHSSTRSTNKPDLLGTMLEALDHGAVGLDEALVALRLDGSDSEKDPHVTLVADAIQLFNRVLDRSRDLEQQLEAERAARNRAELRAFAAFQELERLRRPSAEADEAEKAADTVQIPSGSGFSQANRARVGVRDPEVDRRQKERRSPPPEPTVGNEPEAPKTFGLRFRKWLLGY